MSPASKSKSKDKSAAKAAKEHPKASSKTNGAAASAYNPLSGTFHALETAPSTTTSAPQINGRFRTIDETTEEHNLDTAVEYDSISNNDSCSGESEDQQKEKNNTTAINTSRSETDNEKREKIRLKNEKKHQRQRERRALELHERCCSYLTSRKLESLAQKLVVMGFTYEQATMALIQNEGRVDESALWLVDRGEESKQQAAASNFDGVSAKIDIADELARIAELELRFKCTKQEVERVVVACEGDLEKTEETLKSQKQEPSGASSKLEESSQNSSPNPIVRTAQIKGVAPTSIQLQRRDERDFNYTKSNLSVTTAQMEAASRILPQPSLRKVQSKADWTKTQAAVPSIEKKWPSTSSSPSPYTIASSPLQVAAAQAKPEARYNATMNGNEVKNNNTLQGTTIREPIHVMQRPQSNGTIRQNVLGSSPPSSTGWYPNGTNGGTNVIEMMKLAANGGLGQQLRNLSLVGSNIPQQQQQQQQQQRFYYQDHYHHPSSYMEPGGGSYNMMHGTNGMRSSSSLAVPSSLGLFTGWGPSSSSGTSSPVDWSTRGSIPQRDYTSIDWSLDSTAMSLTSSYIKGERLYDNSWHASSYNNSTMPLKAAATPMSAAAPSAAAASGSSQEWTSPFAGRDMFRAPRHFVTTSPSP